MFKSLTAALLSGVMVALAFPTTNMTPLAWIGLIPLLWSLETSADPWFASVLGLVFGLGFFGVDLRWIYDTIILHGRIHPFAAALMGVGLAALLSLFTGLFGLISGLLMARSFFAPGLFPMIWVGCEYARAKLLTGFPWDLLGYSQANFLTIAQVADITGIYGVGFIIVLVNVAIMEALRILTTRRVRGWRVIALAVVALSASLIYGQAKISGYNHHEPGEKGWTVGVLQGAIAQEHKWLAKERYRTVDAYTELGEKSANQGAQLLIWPETSLPVLFMGEDPFWKTPSLISLDLGKPILFGAPYEKGLPGSSRFLNSAFVIDGFDILGSYHKIHLVPFGEYMPLNWLLPLGPGLAARQADYSPGDQMRVFSLGDSPPFSVLICYEAIFPQLCGMAIKEGARILINITNDGWFGDSAAPYQHFQMARMRAVEHRTWLIRCANTGISAVVDPAGRVLKRIPLNQRGFFNFTLPSDPRAGSSYTRVGDLFAWACILFILIWAYIMRRRSATPAR
jgi:apolipoprotein N-acyltransferase